MPMPWHCLFGNASPVNDTAGNNRIGHFASKRTEAQETPTHQPRRTGDKGGRSATVGPRVRGFRAGRAGKPSKFIMPRHIFRQGLWSPTQLASRTLWQVLATKSHVECHSPANHAGRWLCRWHPELPFRRVNDDEARVGGWCHIPGETKHVRNDLLFKALRSELQRG